MNNFYSSLVINSKKFPNVHSVFKPRYNKEYFKRITANLNQLESLIEQRCRYTDQRLASDRLKDLKENSGKLAKLKERFEKLKPGDDKFSEALEQLETIEDRLMPTVVSIPNRLSSLVPPKEEIIDEVKSDFQERENLVKVLSHRKLSYINNCYSKSVVGPNSHYYFGIGAKLQHALSNYFTNQLESENFIPVSGLCLVKSAVVEAANSQDGKEYFDDPARVINNDRKYTTLHLSESSRESLLGFITTLGHIASNNPIRLMTSGSSYRVGSDWFDGDDKRITQTETVHALVLNPSIEQYSMNEYQRVRDLIWASYKKLDLPVRLIHCAADGMLMNEFDAHRVDVWLPSRHQWIQVSRVSHYRDYITIRAGMKRGHLVDSMVYDGQALVAAIIENRQTALGKFIIPKALAEHLTAITTSERESYLRDSSTVQGSGHSLPPAQSLINHEQRRYLVRKEYLFGHSKKREYYANKTALPRMHMMLAGWLVFFLTCLDWEGIWCDYLSDGTRQFLWDKVRLPVRRIYFKLFIDEKLRPIDKPYAEIDKSKYYKTPYERMRDSEKVHERKIRREDLD